MNAQRLIQLIDIALLEVDNIVAKSKFFRSDEEPILSTKLVLQLLKDRIIQDPHNIDERILRAMHDVGMSSFKDFENTPLENAIMNVTSVLYRELPIYKDLKPLRIDFGKGDPI
jgi:hypothetical protein